MADFSSSHSHSHLEKMGRELKCPICLSLLSSAVSLTCNHVFCNSCIEKSMKSASSCPVCKVPYRRREIRPAPHMDNLVSIYKSMEVASGVNIFVTQNVPSTKLSDEENQSEGGRIFGRQESGRTCQETTENQRKCKRRRSKQLLKINQENSDLDTVKPSFPTKKRVQVPQYPPSQKPATFEGGMDEMTKFQPEKCSGALKENPSLNEKGEAFFTPFFWLRDDEDVEKLTQPTYGDHNMETPPNVPCFSDIKDSGDEIPSKVSPKGGTNTTLDDADYFDSEMFEWTQRPCSPELCSSPVRTQVKKCKLSQQNAATTGKQGTDDLETVVSKQQTNHVEVSLTALSSPRSNDTKTDGRMKISIKRGRKASGKSKKKQDKKSKGEVLGVQVDPEKVADGTVHEKKYNNDVNPLDLKKRILTRDKKVIFDDNAAELLPENNSALSLEANPLNQDNNTVGSDLRASTNPKDSSIRSISRKRDHRKSSKFKITTNLKCDQVVRCSKKQKITTDDITMDNKFNGVQDGCVEASTENTEPLAKFQSNSEFRDLLQSPETEKARPASNGVVLRKCGTVPNKILCAFCHSTEDSEASGVMVHYLNGKPVAEDYNGGSKVIHAHRNCTEWAPNVYFEDDNVINLEAELKRSRRIKCCCCDIKGAALGCYEKSCRKSFHIPCAKLIPQCRWDNDNFVMLCPLHASSKLPNEISGSQMEGKKKCIPKRSSKIHQSEIVVKHTSNTCWHWNSRSSFGKLVLCCSALTDEEKEIVSDFERLSGVVVLKKWDSNITHVIASTDQNGACKRTLKVLMGILEGKWILNFEWIKACMKAMEPVDEQLYEIGVDIHGIRDGPRLGRLRVLNKQPKLFNGCKFYFTGEFVPSYKGYLHDLVIAAGGTVLQRKPISRDQELMLPGNSSSSTFIIYSREVSDKSDPNKRSLILNQRRFDAEALACSTGAIVASNSLVLNSISAYKLQNLAE